MFSRRPSKDSAPPTAPWAAAVVHKRAIAADGTGIAYDVVGEGARTLLVANGLGGRLYAWQPVIDAFWKTYRIITWDYRGLFAPIRRLRNGSSRWRTTSRMPWAFSMPKGSTAPHSSVGAWGFRSRSTRRPPILSGMPASSF